MTLLKFQPHSFLFVCTFFALAPTSNQLSNTSCCLSWANNRHSSNATMEHQMHPHPRSLTRLLSPNECGSFSTSGSGPTSGLRGQIFAAQQVNVCVCVCLLCLLGRCNGQWLAQDWR